MTKKCNTCGWLHPLEKCGHNYGSRSGQAVDPEKDSCEKYETETQKLATGLIMSGVECAKYGVGRASSAVLNLALSMEEAGSNRKGIILLLKKQLRKIDKAVTDSAKT
jgi:hypothetical protein